MAGRRTFPWPILALLAALAGAASAQAESATEIVRLKPATDAKSNTLISAEHIHTWTDGDETVHALAGHVVIEQDQTKITTNAAVLWATKQSPTQLVIYATSFGGKKVGIQSPGSDRKEVETALIEYTTPRIGRIRGGEVQKSLADTPLYRSALAARGRVAPEPGPKPRSVGQDTAGSSVEPAQFGLPPPKSPIDPPPPPEKIVSGTTVIPVPHAETRVIWMAPRTNRPFNITPVVTEKDKAAIVTGGIKLIVRFTSGSVKSIEMEADQVVIWQKGGDVTPALNAMRTEEGDNGTEGIEVYLSGDVIVRLQTMEDKVTLGVLEETRTFRAERAYYDVENHKAIAVGADFEFKRANYQNVGHLVAEEIHMLSSTEMTAFQALLHASRLPSDPAFVISFDRADVYREPRRVRRTVFGTPFRDRLTGEIVEEEPDILEMTNMTAELHSIPIFYLPYARTNLQDPFGPLEEIRVRQNSMFGYQLLVTWDMLDLVGLTPLENERWHLLTDYLSDRGPALGTNYQLSGQKFFDLEAPFQTLVKAYGIYDQGTDLIGSPRQQAFMPSAFRGRFLFRHQQQFTLVEREDLTLQSQASLITDRNFLEQYYNNEYHFGPSQETFVWLKYQTGNTAGTFLFEPDVGRDWVTETFWLPRVDGYLLGQSLFDRLTYHTWANAGYARLDPFRQPADEFPEGVDNGLPVPEAGINTARFDWMQQISAPFDLGPTRVVPYGVLDLAYYTRDLDGSQRGRVYGGGGLRASVPLSRLYPDVESELFNVQGIYHKNVFSMNYYVAGSTTAWNVLPQLDRLNDEATENAWRNVTPWQTAYTFIPRANAEALAFGSQHQFNPRLYAIRRLVDSKPDTLDDIHEVNLNWRQRFQTKRGYPGLEHTVNWLTLDLSGTIFPVPDRDNFGEPVGFLEYALTWAVGDRTTFFSNGWFDPFDYGARYWEVGTFFARDDRTLISFSYKNVDPIQSRYISIATTYVFSPKYYVTAAMGYDLGYTSSLGASVMFTRVGTDLTISVGFNYNSLINNFGIDLNILPNLMATDEQIGNVNQPGQSSRGGR